MSQVQIPSVKSGRVFCAFAGCWESGDRGRLFDLQDDGWLIMGRGELTAVCPTHMEFVRASGVAVFGPEYESRSSRVPVDGDLLLCPSGMKVRQDEQWVPWSAAPVVEPCS